MGTKRAEAANADSTLYRNNAAQLAIAWANHFGESATDSTAERLEIVASL